MKIKIENCAVLDPVAPWGYSAGQNILIEDQRIKSVSGAPIEEPVDRGINGDKFLAIPGLINAHTHSPENFTRATDDRLPLEPWLVHLVWGSDSFSERDHYLTAMVGVIEMLRSGTTSVLDHLSLPPKPNLAGINGAMKAYRDSGIRAGVAPMIGDASYDVEDGEDRGHETVRTVYAGAQDEQGEADLFGIIEEFFKNWHHSEQGRLRCWVGPSGVQWVTLDFLHRCRDLARRYNGGLHMHLMETRVQDHVCRKVYSSTATSMLAKEGLLGPDVSLPHSVWLTDKDVERIASAGAVPVHNPAANLKLGSGFAPIRKMFDAGIIPALGADGSKSSDHQVMFGHLHLAALIHNLTLAEPHRWLASREVFRMATEGGAAALMLPQQLGQIRPGYLADLVLLDLESPSLTPFNDAYHHLAFTELGQSVHTVIIDGKVVVEDGKIVTFDVKAILEETREAARERAYRKPMPKEWAVAMERFLSYQQDIVHNTRFEED
jgi:5-methylthioadenosine/S-adenosylhomocysteine deaminase